MLNTAYLFYSAELKDLYSYEVIHNFFCILRFSIPKQICLSFHFFLIRTNIASAIASGLAAEEAMTTMTSTGTSSTAAALVRDYDDYAYKQTQSETQIHC